MAEVAAWELQDDTQSLLERVAAGECMTITVDGVPTAELRPVGRRPRWMTSAAFTGMVVEHQADAALAGLVEELTEELPAE